MSAAKAKKSSEKNWNLAGSSWAGAWKVFAGIGALGIVGAGIGYTQDPKRFAFSWLFAFVTVLTVCLGSMFFVLVQRLTSAGWSVTVRRTAEFFMLGVVALVPMFLPVLATMGDLFPWLGDHHGAEHGGGHEAPKAGEHHGSLNLITPAYAAQPAAHDGHAEPGHGQPLEGHVSDPAGKLPGTLGGPPSDMPAHGAHRAGLPSAHAGHGEHAFGPAGDPHAVQHNEVLQKKKPYLNKTFFLIRMAIYFFVWVIVAVRLFGYSTAQDTSKDPKLTLKAQAFAPGATALYALTLTFGAFDWIMSLEPTWFSTIFGVVIFACGVVSSLAVIILTTLALRDAGPLDGAVTIEHFHDLGKLMFGFLVFWAYVGFSQYMLIWYAALPEETTFYHHRWDNAPWATVSTAIILFHFVVPFFWTISRNFKRNVGRLQIGAAIILVMHVVDMYWFVMPNFHVGKPGFAFHWVDVACLLAVAGVYGAFVFNRMNQHSLVPVGDPRLQRSLEFQNA